MNENDRAMPALEIRDLRYSYPNGTPALRGVSFSVEGGESVAIIGPNGAGKSTLLLHLNGILRGEGVVRVMGIQVEEKTLREIRGKVGVVFQDPEDQLFLNTVAQDVAFGPANMGLDQAEIEQRVTEALASVGMAAFADRSTHLLSFGEKKRIATATVLAMQPGHPRSGRAHIQPRSQGPAAADRDTRWIARDEGHRDSRPPGGL